MSKGYNNIPSLMQTVLDIPMFEGNGLLAHDVSRLAALDKTMTLNVAPPWTQLPLSNLTFLDFDATNPDFLELAQAQSTDMDFTVSAFSLMAWAYFVDIALGPMLFCRGLLDTDGWYMNVLNDGTVGLTTNQAAASQVTNTAPGAVVTGRWYQLAATRLTTDVLIYVNAVDATDTAGVHTDPLTANRKLHIGCYDDEASNGLHGYIWRPRVWSRQLSAFEMLSIFEQERALFGV